MGSQVSDCRCNSESREPKELNLVRKKTIPERETLPRTPPERQKTPPAVREPSPPRIVEVGHESPGKEALQKLDTPKNSHNETSHSNDTFRVMVNMSIFSKDAQVQIKQLEMEIPAAVKIRQQVKELIEEEEGRATITTDNHKYYGGMRGSKYHGIGYTPLT